MRKTLATMLAIAGSIGTAAYAADRAIKIDDRLDASADTLTDMMKAFDKGIPQDMLNKARCVVVVPGMKKAGFIFGADYGRGFEVCRRSGGLGWSAPAGMRSEGGSIGFQIGASETDVVLLVMKPVAARDQRQQTAHCRQSKQPEREPAIAFEKGNGRVWDKRMH